MASSRWFAARHPNRDQGLMEIVVGIIWERSQRNPLVHMPEPSLGPRFVEFAGIDFVEGISCCVVVVEVKATVLRGTESRDAFFVERVYIRSDFAGVGHGACADRFQSLGHRAHPFFELRFAHKVKARGMSCARIGFESRDVIQKSFACSLA